VPAPSWSESYPLWGARVAISLPICSPAVLRTCSSQPLPMHRMNYVGNVGNTSFEYLFGPRFHSGLASAS